MHLGPSTPLSVRLPRMRAEARTRPSGRVTAPVRPVAGIRADDVQKALAMPLQQYCVAVADVKGHCVVARIRLAQGVGSAFEAYRANNSDPAIITLDNFIKIIYDNPNTDVQFRCLMKGIPRSTLRSLLRFDQTIRRASLKTKLKLAVYRHTLPVHELYGRLLTCPRAVLSELTFKNMLNIASRAGGTEHFVVEFHRLAWMVAKEKNPSVDSKVHREVSKSRGLSNVRHCQEKLSVPRTTV